MKLERFAGRPGRPYVPAIKAAPFIFTAGYTGFRADGSVPEDFAEQVRIIIERARTNLEKAGSSLRHVVSTTAYLTDQERGSRHARRGLRRVFRRCTADPRLRRGAGPERDGKSGSRSNSSPLPPTRTEPVSKQDIAARWRRAQQLMVEQGLDALLVTEAYNYWYFTGPAQPRAGQEDAAHAGAAARYRASLSSLSTARPKRACASPRQSKLC